MRTTLVILLLVLAASASAQEQRGCDKFAWSLEAEKAALAGSETQVAGVDGEHDRDSTAAISVQLAPFEEAKLVRPPERSPKKQNTFAGSLSFAASDTAGKYRITLPEAAWIDVIQGDRYLKPFAFTGALDCPGVRKSVAFEIGAEPFVLQLSDVSAQTISVVLTPAN